MALTRKQYERQAANCIYRVDRNGNTIEMKLTFEEWLWVWETSGHAHERGRASHQYCMSRIDDMGHYELGNVVIKTNFENVGEASKRQKGKKREPHSPERRQKISEACKGRTSPNKGKKLTAEHKAALSRACTDAHRQKMSDERLGKPRPKKSKEGGAS